jgi:hypothetical protein
VVSADKMMIHAGVPVWHRKQQQQGMIPKGLTGLDTAASGSDRKGDSWVYGHGTFCMGACKSRLLGAFKWMRNRANEAKRLWRETGKLKGLMTTVLMDSKADDPALFSQMPRQRRVLRRRRHTREPTNAPPASA